MLRVSTFIILCLFAALISYASEACRDGNYPAGNAGECAVALPADSAAAQQPLKKRGFIGRIVNYFEKSNQTKPEKKFDFSVIGGPHYSSDTKLGIGLVAAGLYRTDTTGTPTSNMAIYADATTSMFFKLGVRGNHILPHDRARLQYDLSFSSVKTKFWGIGYDMGSNDANESDYKYFSPEASAAFVWRVIPSLYVGPFAAVNYIDGRDFERPGLWEGLPRRTFNVGVGFTVQFDNRDCITAASRGVLARLDQRFSPRFLFNRHAFSLTELTLAFYRPVWTDASIALQYHARISYGNTPWGLLSTLGGSDNMRGYFEGRYRDKSEMDVCLELRQHIWHRNGAVVWVGGGTVFPRFSDIRSRSLLPNYGIGYRWEFKKKVNVRLDLGFGRHQTGFIFSINEAF